MALVSNTTVNLNLKKDQIYHLKSIESADQALIRRLRDLGIYEGLSIKLINIISFGSVYVLQLNESIVALNEREMACLKF